MDTGEEAAIPAAAETGTPDRLMEPLAAGMKPAGSAALPLGPDLFEGEPDPPRAPAPLRRLMESLESRSGNRGARLAAINLRAGIAPPALRTELPGAGGVQAALWMELARENATLRREAARLEERQHRLSRRIERARTRVQELRLKLLQGRLGLTPGSLRDIPLGDAYRGGTAAQRAQPASGEPDSQIEPAAEPGAGEARRDKD